MTTPTPQPTLPHFLVQLVFTLFTLAMIVGIMVGVREGFALVIPAGFCAGTPVEPTVYVLSVGFFIHLAFPKHYPDWRARLRFGAALLVAASVAVLAARLAAGCTPLTDWFPDGRIIVEALILNTVFVPLTILHREFIEPRWARAMGDGGEAVGEDDRNAT